MRSFVRCLSWACAVALAATVAHAGPQTLSVQVRSGELRESPSFLGKVVATLNYGDRVVVEQQQGAWWKATAENGGASGWIHSSAVTTQTIRLQSSGTAQSSASSGELALAYKGFNSDVEAQFKAQNGNLDYTWIDRMEAIRIPESRMAAFVKQGDLHPKGGQP